MRAMTMAGIGLATALFTGCATESSLKPKFDAQDDRMSKLEGRMADLERKVDAQAAQMPAVKADAQRAEDAARRAEASATASEDAARRADASAAKAAKAFELKQRK
jgi:outer membrane murein-binding lipoprotein Lpp